ncbi:MAG: cell division protein SepF [Clostridia bacterium]
MPCKKGMLVNMNNIKVNNFVELENIRESLNESKFIIDLEDAEITERKRIMDFFTGMTYLKGSIKKININEFEISILDK